MYKTISEQYQEIYFLLLGVCVHYIKLYSCKSSFHTGHISIANCMLISFTIHSFSIVIEVSFFKRVNPASAVDYAMVDDNW